MGRRPKVRSLTQWRSRGAPRTGQDSDVMPSTRKIVEENPGRLPFSCTPLCSEYSAFAERSLAVWRSEPAEPEKVPDRQRLELLIVDLDHLEEARRDTYAMITSDRGKSQRCKGMITSSRGSGPALGSTHEPTCVKTYSARLTCLGARSWTTDVVRRGA